MNFKTSLVAASLLSASALAFAASPVTLASPSPAQPSILIGSFSALVSGAEFSFLVKAGDVLDKITVASTHSSKSKTGLAGSFVQTAGFDITKVYFDNQAVGADIAPLPTASQSNNTWNMVDFDNWSFAPGQQLTAGLHVIKIEGLSKAGGGFTGNVQITAGLTPAVPEPQTYALLLAGLGAIGFAARRRAAV